MMFRLLSLIAVPIFLAACAQGPVQPPPEPLPVSADRLRDHVEFLADDTLRGRDTGSEGYQLAAEYVANEFARLGLKPGVEGSFFQRVPLVEARLVQGSARARVATPSRAVELAYPDQFISGPSIHVPDQDVSGKLVFVGYGIVAPEFGHDDYAGLDVEGKIVVSLVGRPAAWPSEEGAHLGGGREKSRHAAEHGAIGRIILHSPREEETFPFKDQLQYLDIPSMNWVGTDGQPDGYWPKLRGGGYLTEQAAELLFEGSPTSLEAIYQADIDGRPVPGFALKTSASFARKSSLRQLQSPNVVAVLEGNDPELKNEYLVYTAHLDHLGVIKNAEGVEEIYNGAMDNAAGVATLLETARVLQAERASLKRSVIFLVVTGEEKGLLGAGYYAKNPTVPIDSIVANINLDMPLFLYPIADVVAFGAEHSNLKGYVSRAAEAAGVTLSPDPMPEQSVFVRSDHYRFVQQGIPAVFLVTGFASKDPQQAFGEVFQAHMAAHYHKPSDDLNLSIDYKGGALFTEINVNIGREIANDRERPHWNEGDFFGDTFAREKK